MSYFVSSDLLVSTSASTSSESCSPFLFFSVFLLSMNDRTTPSANPTRIVAPLVST